MPQRIEVPGMGIVEFPDGMNDADISAAIRRSMPQEMPKPDAPGVGEAMLIGAGRGTDKLVQGVRQGYNWMTGDQATLDRMKADEAEKDRLYRPLQEARPVATGIGEMAPAVAAGFMTGGSSVAAGAASAGLPSLLSYGTPEERLKRGTVDAFMGGTGAKAGQMVARVLKPAGVGAAGVSDDALAAAQRIGYKPMPSQIANNQGMAAFENYLQKTPGSSGLMQKAVNANQTALNRAGAKAMGETADSLDEGVFAAAKSRVGSEFERLGEITKPVLGDDFINTLAKIESSNSARGAFASKEVKGLIDKGLDLAAKGDLDGVAYKEIRSELSNEASKAFKAGDSSLGQAYKALRNSLDKAAKGSLSEADQKAWDAARSQWDAFKTLSKSNVAEAGSVSAARTAAAVRAKNPNFRTGGLNGEMADIARVGEAFKSVGNPNSGQLAAQQMLYGNPFTGIPLMLGNRAMAGAYMSPAGQRYFSRGLLDIGQTGRGLLGQGGAVLAVPGGRALLGVE
jgi:hypothetical protein